MALPSVIDSAGGPPLLATSTQGRARPFFSSTGKVFVFLRVGSVNTRLIVYFTDTPETINWEGHSGGGAAIVTLANSGILLGYGVVQDGDELHIATQDDNEAILYHLWNMSSESFTTSNEAVTSAVGTDINADKAISIELETDGSIIIFYQGASESVMGAKERVNYAFKPSGGSWTVDQAVDAGGAFDYFLGGIVRGEANKFHLVFRDAVNVRHRSLQDVDGTLSGIEGLNDNDVDGSQFIVFQPVYYDDAGVERITCAWQGSSTVIRTSEIDDDGIPGAEENASDNTPHTNGEFGVASLAVDVKDAWLIYADTTQDVFSDVNSDSAGWGTDTEELDAITCNLITSNVYTRNDIVVLAYVYDDGGTIKYNEKFLRLVGNSAFADARLPRQNYHVGPFQF